MRRGLHWHFREKRFCSRHAASCTCGFSHAHAHAHVHVHVWRARARVCVSHSVFVITSLVMPQSSELGPVRCGPECGDLRGAGARRDTPTLLPPRHAPRPCAHFIFRPRPACAPPRAEFIHTVVCTRFNIPSRMNLSAAGRAADARDTSARR